MSGIRCAVLAFLLAVTATQETTTPVDFEHFQNRGVLNLAAGVPKTSGCGRVLVGGGLTLLSSQGKGFVTEYLDSGGFDAVAVGWEDLESPGVREILASEKIPFVCANVKGAGRTHVIRTIGSQRVAFVGLTRVPAYLKGSPQGWTIEDPETALKGLLPGIAKEADLIVLLALMDRLECAELLKQVPGISVALSPAIGGNDPDPLRVGGAILVQSPGGASALGTLSLKIADRKVSGATNRVDSAQPSPADLERMRALFAKHKEGVDTDRLVAGVVVAPPAAPVAETGPLTDLSPGKTQPVVILRSDGSIGIRIESIRVVTELEGHEAPRGVSWLVIRSEWKNLIPPATVDGRELHTAFSVGDAANNLYVIANGRTLVRLDVDLSTGPGGLLTGRSIRLEKQGSIRLGDLVFPLPPSGAETLDLQYYDFRHPPVVFPLLARPKVVEEKPVVPAAKNEVLEAGVFAVRREKGSAPEGMAVAVIDLRVRSLVSVEVEGKRIGVVGDIDDAWKGLVLATDGGRESAPEPGLPASPRFLPGAMTGWDVRFLIPEKATTLVLRWSLPEIGMPDGRALKPGLLTFPLALKAGACPDCGTVPDPTDKFCGKCGRKLGP